MDGRATDSASDGANDDGTSDGRAASDGGSSDNSATENAATGQVAATAAEVYEAFFVPALFGQWPDQMLDLGDVGTGMSVLDVGCGTGILARTALDRVGATGSVTGLDPNPGMLTVARRTEARIRWLEGHAEQMPVDDGTFDRVMSQFALMFFRDRSSGLREMARVGAPGATAVVATWAALETSPGYAAMVELLDRLFGHDVAEALNAPFVLGDADEVREMMSEHFDDVSVHTCAGTARFDSIEAWVHTDVRGWTLADMITDDQYLQLLDVAQRELSGFTDDTGRVEFAAPALIATGKCR